MFVLNRLTGLARSAAVVVLLTAAACEDDQGVRGPRLATIEVSPPSVTIEVGESEQLIATALDDNGQPIDGAEFSWSSLNTSVVSVSAAGLVTGIGAGASMVVAATGDSGKAVAVQVTEEGGPAPLLPAANRFVDGLESANKSAEDPGGINVAPLFSWAPSNGIPFTIVRDDGCLVTDNNGEPITPLCGFEARQWENAPDGTNGHHAARFRYPPNSGDFAEQRFELGADYPEIWLRWWVRVPINYKHENIRGSSTNNKFFAIWQGTYDNLQTRIWEYHPDGTGGSRLAWHAGIADPHQDHADFISWPSDQGRWMQLVVHLKVSSAPGAADGILQLYRRWENESVFTLLHNRTDAVINTDPGHTGFRRGFFMGASNSWWAEATEFLLDRFEVSTTSLVPAP